ncbi:hypothetical protein [Pedobacter duraquae]|uniref:Uncharacterized protein n=1 Tax=Pedobacter duraquae TaxID=425511 RepID=A0A4R6IK02_9SPHI|nr:hypothetical protein [Pedobacter duraquae]TDO22372.1 hypothetical protein CLV32_1343 [Pedobacter duraquae]
MAANGTKAGSELSASNNVKMEKVRELKQLYTLCLSISSMHEAVKIELKIRGRNLLFLSQLIQKGLVK